VKNFENVGVTGYDPRVQKRIPMDGIFVPQAVKEFVRVGEYRRIEEMIKAQRRVIGFDAGRR
jgi:hypothetical protein